MSPHTGGYVIPMVDKEENEMEGKGGDVRE